MAHYSDVISLISPSSSSLLLGHLCFGQRLERVYHGSSANVS